jgi:hypothetical protein
MGNTLGALRRSMVVMTVMVMVFQNNVLQSQVNTAGPGCGKQFVSELGPGYVWSEAANARCDDDETRAYAAPLVKGEFTQALKISNFGFALPADARVEGIEVVIIRKGDVAGAIIDKSVKLMKGNAVVGSDLHARDLWTVREINSPGFGVAVSAMSAGAIARPQIDEVLVTVHFSYGVESARTHKASSSASRYTCNGWGS